MTDRAQIAVGDCRKVLAEIDREIADLNERWDRILRREYVFGDEKTTEVLREYQRRVEGLRQEREGNLNLNQTEGDRRKRLAELRQRDRQGQLEL